MNIAVEGAQVDVACLGIWPDNWLTLQVFRRMLTQWFVGPAGVVGLRYESLPTVMRACRVEDAEWGETMDCLQIMEHAVLKLLERKG